MLARVIPVLRATRRIIIKSVNVKEQLINTDRAGDEDWVHERELGHSGPLDV